MKNRITLIRGIRSTGTRGADVDKGRLENFHRINDCSQAHGASFVREDKYRCRTTSRILFIATQCRCNAMCTYNIYTQMCHPWHIVCANPCHFWGANEMILQSHMDPTMFHWATIGLLFCYHFLKRYVLSKKWWWACDACTKLLWSSLKRMECEW